MRDVERRDWAPEELATCARMWTAGDSAGEIAKVLTGRTRNAVIGKLGRLGLMGTRGGKPRTLKPEPEPVVTPPPRLKARPVEIAFTGLSGRVINPHGNATFSCEPVGIMDLDDHHCRAIVRYDDAGMALYCGYGRVLPSAYCPTHAAAYHVRTLRRDPWSISRLAACKSSLIPFHPQENT